MPVQHVVLVKFKEGVTKEQVDALYTGLMSLESKPFIISITAGENFDGKGSEWSFTYVITISSLRAYKEDKSHQAIVEQYLTPIAAAVTSSDFDFPRHLSEHLVVGASEDKPMTPSRMRFNPAASHPDIEIIHGTLARPRVDFAGERFVVASHPVQKRLYFDVKIELNPRPAGHDIAVGIIAQGDLDKAKETGSHFKIMEGAFGWESNSGFVGLGPGEGKLPTIPTKEWPHDVKIGVFVDRERGFIQFFFNRKKHGPTIHSDAIKEHKYFPAVCIGGKGCEVSIDFNASCPPVFFA